MIFYSDDKDREPLNLAALHRLDPTACYLKHFGNMLYLQFIALRSNDWAEKRQAEKEIKICQRKLDYWYRFADIDRMTRGCDKLKKDWASTPTKVKGPQE